jgi:hypothetical protein
MVLPEPWSPEDPVRRLAGWGLWWVYWKIFWWIVAALLGLGGTILIWYLASQERARGGNEGGAIHAADTAPGQQVNFVAGRVIQLNDNGAWSWFMDERALVREGKLIVGSVRSVGNFANAANPDWGNVEIAVHDLAGGATQLTILHRHFEQDDHDSPGLLVLPDNRLLAMYSKHNQERKIYYRFSEPGNPLLWGPVHEIFAPEKERGSFRANITYNNLFRLETGRIYDFYRGLHLDPNYVISDDDGKTWTYGGRLLKGKGGYSPYVRYAFDGKKTIHFLCTEDHPRNYNNSIYHGFLRDGQFHLSDGKVLAPLSTSSEARVAAWDFTRIFAGDADNVCWIDDVRLDAEGRPRVIFSVKKDGRGTRGFGGQDIRFYYGSWDRSTWRTYPLAYAGNRLYPFEADYTGLTALDRQHPGVVYLSTNADPVSGTPLVSAADNRRHHELFRGTSGDGGKTWQWQPLTANSSMDNLRPIVPAGNDPRTVLVWMRGSYRHNRGDWTTAVVAVILPSPH